MTKKTCATCKWVTDNDGEGTYAKCTAPEGDSLTGFASDRDAKWCSSQRRDGWLGARVSPPTCGREGRWWKPRESGQ